MRRTLVYGTIFWDKYKFKKLFNQTLCIYTLSSFLSNFHTFSSIHLHPYSKTDTHTHTQKKRPSCYVCVSVMCYTSSTTLSRTTRFAHVQCTNVTYIQNTRRIPHSIPIKIHAAWKKFNTFLLFSILLLRRNI